MTLPAQFTDAVRAGDKATIVRWLEIEGIADGYGSASLGSSWFAARAAAAQLNDVLPYLKAVPTNFDAELDPLDGVAKTMGQVDFRITDIAGEQTKWAGNRDKNSWLLVSTAVAVADVTIFYSGVADANYPATNGFIFLGTETIKYAAIDTVNKKFTGCTRAMFGSKAQAWALETPISYKLYTLFGRRVWYYQTAQRPGGAAPVDGDKVLRFSGTVENFYMDDTDPATYVLECRSIEFEFTRDVFTDLRSYQDSPNAGIVGTDFSQPGIRFGGEPGGNGNSAYFYGSDVAQLNEDGTKHFVESQQFFFRVDNEIIGVLSQVTNTPSGLRMNKRAAFNTVRGEHRAGFTLKEIAWVARYDTNGDYENLCQFKSVPDANSPCPADHPLMVLLQILLSTGTGLNTISGRNYDVLPATWSLGIDISRVDVAGIVALSLEMPDLVVSGVWEGPVKFAALCKELLSPYGMFGVTTIGDVFTVRRLRPPMPDENTRVISENYIINKSKPSWNGNLVGLVQEVHWNYSKDIMSGVFLNHTPMINAQGKAFAQRRGRVLKYELPHVYLKGASVPGNPPGGGMANPELTLQERIDFYRQGYILPPSVFTIRGRYELLDIEPGDILAVTFSLVPNASNGTRGLTAQLMRCNKKTIDDGSKTVTLIMLDTGYGLGNYRYVTPSFEIIGVNGGFGANALLVQFNSFTPLTSVDDSPIGLDGVGHSWIQDLITAGGTIRLVTKDFLTTTTAVATSFDQGDEIVYLSAAVPGGYGAGDFVIPRPADRTIAGFTGIYAFMVDADLLLGAETAHRYFP